MDNNTPVTIFWFRRDLRLNDNAGFYRALKSGNPVLPIFIFDQEILDKLEDKNDARVTFIYNTIENLRSQLHKHGSSLLVLYDKATNAWDKIIKEYPVATVYTNHDYEPYATKRDDVVKEKLKQHGIAFHTFKDQVIFEKDEVTKDDGKPYTVYTPYQRKWYATLKPFYLKSYPTEKYLDKLVKIHHLPLPSLNEMGFVKSEAHFPDQEYKEVIGHYAEKRDFPATKGTSHIGLHLRFGTVSIRELAKTAHAYQNKTWLNELIWREFYMMILHHFPHTMDHAFRPEYDRIKWVNNEDQFKAWCEGQTGYPIIDAGMRELKRYRFYAQPGTHDSGQLFK